jgi:hypothetical protein
MRSLVAAALVSLLAACTPPTSCSSGSFSCGDPAGGPECCPTGDSCCFGWDLCCIETKPHLGVSRANGAKGCYASLAGEGSTWDLLTVCGKPAN